MGKVGLHCAYVEVDSCITINYRIVLWYYLSCHYCYYCVSILMIDPVGNDAGSLPSLAHPRPYLVFM